MKKLLVLFFGLTLFKTGAQSFLPEYTVFDTTKPYMLRVSYQAGYHSSDVPNSFLSFFLNGGTISNDVKQHVSNNLSAQNRIGGDQSFSLRFYDLTTHPFKDKEWGVYFNVEHQEHVALNFSKQLFDLVFFGNGPYTGQTLNLAPFNFARYKYQKFGFGLLETTSGTSFGVSVVKGQTLNSIDFTRANFYTDDSTAAIQFDYAADISRSDTNKTKWTAFNGVGLAFDVTWNFKILPDSVLPDITRWQLRVQNAGFLIWNTASLNYSADTLVQYNGFEVNNILKPEEALILGNTNLADTLNIKYKSKKVPILLPADVVFGNYVNPYAGYWLKPLLGFRYKLMQGYTPMFYAGASMRASKRICFQTTGSYGGFGGFRVGLRMEALLGKRFHFIAGTSALDGIYGSSRFAKDGYVALWVKF